MEREMDEGGTVKIENGTIHIDHPEIEAGLAILAERWGTTMEEALGRCLESALEAEAQHLASTMPEQLWSPDLAHLRT